MDEGCGFSDVRLICYRRTIRMYATEVLNVQLNRTSVAACVRPSHLSVVLLTVVASRENAHRKNAAAMVHDS